MKAGREGYTEKTGILVVTLLLLLALLPGGAREQHPEEGKRGSTSAVGVAIALAAGVQQDDLRKYRERANSDDAQTIEEAFFHANARALVISNIEPNKLRVGGHEFRVKRNPAGEGCFVYDPRTQFHGVKRYLVWWVPKDGKAYPLNSPSKMVTPGLNWPRDEGIAAPTTSAVIDYVFEGKPMATPRAPASTPKAATFTVREYRIYRAVISAPMSVSEAQTLESAAKRYGMTASEARKATD